MQKLLVILLLTVFTTVGATAQNIGVVNMMRLNKESKKSQASFKEIQDLAKAKKDEIQPKLDAIKDKQKAAQEKLAAMSDEEKKEKAEEIKKMAEEIQTMALEFRKLASLAEQEAREKINEAYEDFAKQIAPIVEKIAEERKLDVVLKEGVRSPVIYYAEKVDITDEVIKRYDALK